MLISIVNRSARISDEDVQAALRAINRQIEEDFEPYWSFGAHLRLEGAIGRVPDKQHPAELRGDAILYLSDTVDVAGALGYHANTALGIPYGFVFTELSDRLGEAWTVTLSHEALELLADAQANLLVQGPHPTAPQREVFHWFEMCDAVQSESYRVDGVAVSNFVLPSYFTAGEQAGARNDFLGRKDKAGKTLASFGVKPGGYIGFYDPVLGQQTQWAVPADEVAHKRMAIKGAAGSGRGFVRKRSEGTAGPEQRQQDALDAAAVGTTGAPTRTQPMPGADSDPFRHVFVLMMENRSFDQMLGALQQAGLPVDGLVDTPRANLDNQGRAHVQSPQAPDRTPIDPGHEHGDTEMQRAGGAMSGFVTSFEAVCNSRKLKPSDSDLAQIMAYHDVGATPEADSLPVLHTLAREFVVCDRWFSSLPGPTWPNRAFVHSGTSQGVVTMPQGKLSDVLSLHFYTQETVYNRLSAAGINWRIYHHGLSQTVVFTQLQRYLATDHYADFNDFAKHLASATDDFPAYVFIEPDFFGTDRSDQHPPGSVNAGEQLIANVYNALRANEALWRKSLLVIVYDEHGGFYDHVAPPTTVPPDDATQHFDFRQLGVRVPAVLVSPRLAAGISHEIFDHTSLLRYVCDKWQLPSLGLRTAQATSIVRALAPLAAPRTDTPPKLTAHPASPLPQDLTTPVQTGGPHSPFGMAMALPAVLATGRTRARRKVELDALDANGEALLAAVEALAKSRKLPVSRLAAPTDPQRVARGQALFGKLSAKRKR